MADITGRDSYIVAKALAYAIEAIGRLPDYRKELSDQSDMKALLDHMIASDKALARTISEARAHLTGEGLLPRRMTANYPNVGNIEPRPSPAGAFFVHHLEWLASSAVLLAALPLSSPRNGTRLPPDAMGSF